MYPTPKLTQPSSSQAPRSNTNKPPPSIAQARAHNSVHASMWEGGRVGVNEGGKGGGGRERVCEERVVPHKSEPPLAPVLRRAPVQHSIGRRVFRHMVV